MTSVQFSPSFADRDDFENATRGLIASQDPCVIRARNGRVLWDNDAYAFLKDDCPATADPKLWRQGQLNSIQGLFKVNDGIYQVRGFDISNMTIVEGQTGVIVIDPLISVECAQAALNLYQSHRGARKVTGLIYSHSHVDHFGGAQGVLLDDSSINVPILAPEGFMGAALNENIFAGPSMRRRAAFMYGNKIPKGPTGQIGCGLGMTTSAGAISMVPPTVLIKNTGEEHVVDGVRIVFQVVPETEAPAEMNFYFPDRRALCIAECATHGMHNIVTLRGAEVRDAKAWSRYLDETIVLFGEVSDVLFAGHNWPTWGSANIIELVSEQRDLYGYMHDQTVRLMNAGLTGIEIAEIMTLPPALQQAWHAQGYYGSLSHNIKGIYQKYMTWFDGNPAHLWQYPPAEEGKRYLSCMGSVDEVVRKAETFAKEGDLRFAATLLGHAVAAEPAHGKARAALALVFEKLGFGAENATWRNFYLTSAQELRSGWNTERSLTAMDAVNPQLSVEQWLAGFSVRIDGPRAVRQNFAFGLHVVDTEEKWKLIMSNGALTYRRQPDDASDVDLTLKKAELRQMLEGNLKLPPVQSRGDPGLLRLLLSLVSGADSNEARNSHI
ncbi:uncharacterized protein A1O5_10125 [Cladophialophora psammophila CBS 110553]|uniref:Metallo-beta-lactamase domain-containing protein n=1 Tax=Cladophialophora psammophila CBS 110553 TaxID=1182543 RepID=W9WPL5_9EURO|nr:uncharacterized protein A1O5_10125 [Cladophialophora psammophila CBS 110553]EXJ66930.1 hypothetical protein A1O5_10125 [Cladophialophora psammophila CBS 110553]